MKYKRLIGLLAALLALALFSVALVLSVQHGHAGLKIFAWAATAFVLVVGATVNYKYPTSIAPTAQDVYGLGLVSAQVNMADIDTSVDITHSFGLSAQELVDLFPAVIINPTAGGSAFPGFNIVKATNKITLTKANAVNSGGTFDVIILRPHTNQAGPLQGKR